MSKFRHDIGNFQWEVMAGDLGKIETCQDVVVAFCRFMGVKIGKKPLLFPEDRFEEKTEDDLRESGDIVFLTGKLKDTAPHCGVLTDRGVALIHWTDRTGVVVQSYDRVLSMGILKESARYFIRGAKIDD